MFAYVTQRPVVGGSPKARRAIGVLGATLVLAAALAAVAAPDAKALALTAGVNVNLGAE